MNIVIIGAGKVGYALSDFLSKENHNVTIIDRNPALLQKLVDNQDVITVQGNGAVYSVQQEAGVAGADLLIAATSLDEVNVISCLVARKLGARHTIARIRNPEYNEQLFIMQDEFGVSMVINPEHAAAQQIARLVSLPSAASISSFVGDRVIVAEKVIPEGSSLDGVKVMDIHKEYGTRILLCAAGRQGQAYIPNGSFVLQAGDTIYLCGDNKKISEFFSVIGLINRKVRSVMLIGGGRIAFYLAKMLLNMGIEVKIIEKSPQRCQELCRLLPSALILESDGTDLDVLDDESLDEMDAFVSLTDIDEENIIVAMYAKQSGVPKVVCKINRFTYRSILRRSDLDSIISPKQITAEKILQYVRALQNAEGSSIKTLYRLMGGQVEVAEFVASDKTDYLGVAFKDIPFKADILITAIVRKNMLIIPHGADHIEAGDSVVVISKQSTVILDLNDIFRE